MRIRMRRGAAAVLAVSALCLTAACSGSSDDGKKPSAGPESKSEDKVKETPAPTPLTAAQMKAGTLVVTDLPPGYKADKQDDDTSEIYKADKKECQPIAGFLDDKVAGATMGGNADFTGGGGDTLLSQQVLTFPGTGATDFVKAVGSALETCKSFTFTQEGEKLKVTVEKITGPKAGEESFTFRMKTSIPSLAMNFESDMLVARQGTGVTRVAFVPADASGHKAFDGLARRAGEKFVKGAQS